MIFAKPSKPAKQILGQWYEDSMDKVGFTKHNTESYLLLIDFFVLSRLSRVRRLTLLLQTCRHLNTLTHIYTL